MAASSGLFVTVHGVGGHASRPHASADPIIVAAEMVTALQTLVTRQFDVFEPVVITVGTFHAGTRRNVIPSTAPSRPRSAPSPPSRWIALRERSVRLCTQIAAAYGMTADVSFDGEYPVTVNDAEHAEFALEVAADLFGAERSQLLRDPVMGSEDFSRVLEEVPGAYVFLGACDGDDPLTAPTNHSALARFSEAVLPDAALLLAALAVRGLQRLDPTGLSLRRGSATRRDDDGQRDDGRGHHRQHHHVEHLAAHLQQPRLPAGQRDPLDRPDAQRGADDQRAQPPGGLAEHGDDQAADHADHHDQQRPDPQ